MGWLERHFGRQLIADDIGRMLSAVELLEQSIASVADPLFITITGDA